MHSNKMLIYKLLFDALVTIRYEAYMAKQAKIFHLADIAHNMPMSLKKSCETGNYSDVLDWYIKRAEEKGIDAWFEKQIQYVQDHNPSIPNPDDEYDWDTIG